MIMGKTSITGISGKKSQEWIIHVLAMVLLFTIPFFVNPRHRSLSFADYISFMVPMLAFVAVFYANYLYLIKKFLHKRKWGLYLLSNVLIIAFFTIALHFWGDYYFAKFILPNFTGGQMRHDPWFARVFKDITFMVIAVIISIAIKMTSEWYRADKEKAEISSIASQAELKNLKNQLNPHFLFNTLNNIYSLMRVDSEKAQDAILELSKILRYVLNDDDQEKALLRDEIAFTKNYIELMSLRLSKNVTLTTDIPSFEESSETIAPLLFISLVENAFKHGISQTEPSFIDVSIGMDKASGNVLHCAVRNSYFPKAENDYSGSGIGMENLKKRLALIYPGGHKFNTCVENGVYCAELTVKL